MKWPWIWDWAAPRRIVVYADFIDPFCYVGFHNARRAAEAAGVPLIWRGFECNPDTPVEGAFLETAANSDLRPGMWASVRAFARKSGLDLAPPVRAPNTRLAHLWVQTVRTLDIKNSLIELIYQAYLRDQKDIGDPQVLAEFASDCGLPRESIRDLAAERDASRLEQFRRQAMGRRFPGLPGFLYKGKTYFGALSEHSWREILAA